MPTFKDDLHLGHKVPLVETDDLRDGAITEGKISDGAVTSGKLADGSVQSNNIAANAVTTAKIGDNEVKTDNIADGAVTSAKIPDDAITTAKIGAGEVKSRNIAANAVTESEIGNGEVMSAHIAPNAVTTAKIADGNVTEAKIDDKAVTTAKIDDKAVTEDKINDGSVVTSKIADGAITSNLIEGDAVTTEKIHDGAVTTAKIHDGDVTTAKIANGAVATQKLDNGAVTTAKIEDAAVTTAKIGNGEVKAANIATGAVTEAKIGSGEVNRDAIAAGAVTTSKLADKAVGNDQLAAGAVTASKIADDAITGDEIANGAVTTSKIADNAINRDKIDTGAVTMAKIANSAVTTAKIDSGAVTEDKIASGAVTEDKIGAGAVTTTKIADGNVTSDKIPNGAVTTAKIGAGEVKSTNIATGAVTNAKLENYDANNVNPTGVTTQKIADEAVTEDKLADGAVTSAKLADGLITELQTITDAVPTEGSVKPVQSGGVQNELALGAVYDVSAKNPTAGSNNDGKWESLSALLSDANLSTLIPASVRKGGMSIKFVQSSDNKYVQYRLMANTFSTTVTDWQGVDDEPTAGSDNLVKSGGVRNYVNRVTLKEVPYLLSESVFDNPLSVNETNIGAFIRDLKITATRIDGFDYGIVHINNGIGDSEGTKYLISIGRYPTGETPSFQNVIVIGSYSSSNPKYGLISIPNVADMIVNWDSLRTFGSSTLFTGVGKHLLFNQDYIFSDVHSLNTEYIAKEKTSSLSLYDNTTLPKKDSTLTLLLRRNDGDAINPDYQDISEIDINSATKEKAGLMSADDKKTLENNSVIDLNTFENEGEIAYYTESERGVGLLQVAQFTNLGGFKFNKITIGPVKTSQPTKERVVYIMAVEDIRYPANGRLIHSQNIYLTSEFAQYTIELDHIETILANEKVAVYFCCLTTGGNGTMTILGNSNNSPASFSNSNVACYLGSFSESPLEQTWTNGSAGYCAVMPICRLVKIPDYIEQLQQDVEELQQEIEPLTGNVEIRLPDKLYAVVGDTLQVFFRGVVKCINIEDYNIYTDCLKGNCFKRYWNYRPTADDIGNTTLSIFVSNMKGDVIATKSCSLITVASPSSPLTTKGVYCFGDSLTNGIWSCETKRRLTGSSTIDSIQGKSLSNIVFYGKKERTFNDTLCAYFGEGGWNWYNYLVKGDINYRVSVSGVISVAIGDKYSNNNTTYTVLEVNITDGTGSILLSGASSPSESGTLTKVQGSGDNTISFSSVEPASTNPLWDDINNKMSFIPYANTYGNGTIDVVYVLLTWNGHNPFVNYSKDDTNLQLIGGMKQFARTLHAEFPSAKLKVMGIQVPSLNGGFGDNYGARQRYSNVFGYVYTAFSYDKALQDVCNMDEFSPYCEFVDIAAQFDSEYNMPYQDKSVNIRNTAVTEPRGTNAVHPSQNGYCQIADAVYRNFVANFCQ